MSRPPAHAHKKSLTAADGRAGPGVPAIGPTGRLSIGAILDKLDAADDGRFRNRRAGDRVSFRCPSVPVRVIHPGGTISERFVATRNLAASGIGFLYDSFLHLGTRVTFTLPRRLGGTDAIEGKVVYCAHVSGAFHQVGARFDTKIFTKLYADNRANISAAQERSGEAGVTPAQADASACATGRVLLIDPEPMDRALVAHHLRDTQMQLLAVASLDAAIELLQTDRAFSALLIELDVRRDAPVRTVEALRAAGFVGPICASMSAKITPEHGASARLIGVASLLSKPFGRAELIATLISLVSPANSIDALAVLKDAVREINQIAAGCAPATPRG